MPSRVTFASFAMNDEFLLPQRILAGVFGEDFGTSKTRQPQGIHRRRQTQQQSKQDNVHGELCSFLVRVWRAWWCLLEGPALRCHYRGQSSQQYWPCGSPGTPSKPLHISLEDVPAIANMLLPSADPHSQLCRRCPLSNAWQS